MLKLMNIPNKILANFMKSDFLNQDLGTVLLVIMKLPYKEA